MTRNCLTHSGTEGNTQRMMRGQGRQYVGDMIDCARDSVVDGAVAVATLGTSTMIQAADYAIDGARAYKITRQANKVRKFNKVKNFFSNTRAGANKLKQDIKCIVKPKNICFTAGTLIRTHQGHKPIEAIRVGQRVRTTDDFGSVTGDSESKGDSDEDDDADDHEGLSDIDPDSWRLYRLQMANPDGSNDIIDIDCLRSAQWAGDTGAAKNALIDFVLPEMGLRGPARVVDVLPCPAIQAGPGRVVLSTVTHFNGYVLQIFLEGQTEPIEPTDTHRLYSETAGDWIPAGQLEVGQQLRTALGLRAIAKITKKPGIHRVYNIEVDTDHCYYVSKDNVLSHNTNPCAVGFGAGFGNSKKIINKSWKAKIVGTGQKTGTPGHQFRTFREAIAEAKKTDVMRVHLDHGYNRSLGLPPKSISPNRRPDVVSIYADGRVKRFEVVSKSDRPAELMQRNLDLDNQLRARGFDPVRPIVIRPTKGIQ
ncbi:MAG: Hint domain-containing protein [Phycisphaerae bacterium]|nr:Hint domain-containing protein [Phycisphaerae bacterium]